MTQDQSHQPGQVHQPASLGKRLLAIIYDSLIIFFIVVVTTIVIQQVVISLELVPLEKIKDSVGELSIIPPNSWVDLALKNLWALFGFLYLGHYWTRTGQTPGMKVWKIKLLNQTENNQNNPGITILQALKRYVFSLLGLGLLWIPFDKDKRALQDRLSQSYLISVSVPNTI